MTLRRWQPFRELDDWQQEMSRALENISYNFPTRKREGITNVFPSAEMEETDDAIHLRLEIPGVKPEDLDIQVSAEDVSIRGERKSEAKTEEKGMMRTEFYYGQFERVIPLSTRINSKDVKAEYNNGIVALTLPKAEEEKERTVKVTVNS